jgi:serine/threonine-protein kinase
MVKIIDFGFGKKLDENANDKNSILLNWPVSELPNEVAIDHDYNHKSEIYFVGKLYKKIIDEYSAEFKFSAILDKMTRTDPHSRYQHFEEIIQDISAGTLVDLDFTNTERSIYQKFADDLLQHVTRLHSEFEPSYDLPVIFNKLGDVLRTSMLEDYIQNNAKLISCFIRSGYTYIPIQNIEVVKVKNFYEMIKSKDDVVGRVILDNLYARFYTLPVGKDDDLPF